MKQNKNRVINLRVTEGEFEALHRLSKHYKLSIAEFLRSHINNEDLKLLHNEQSQERIFEKTESERMIELNRAFLATVNLLSLSDSSIDTQRASKVHGKPAGIISKGRGNKAKDKRKKGIKQNE